MINWNRAIILPTGVEIRHKQEGMIKVIFDVKEPFNSKIKTD